MGAALDVTGLPQAPAAPEPTPAPASAPAATPAPSEAPAGGSSAQPTTQPAAPPAQAAPGTPAPSEPEAHVPYPRFRQVQREFTQYRRDTEPKLERAEAQIRQFEEQQQQWSQRSRDYDALESLLRENPDVAEALLARAQGRSPQPAGTAPAASVPSQPQNLHPALLAKLDKVDKMAAAWERANAERAVQREAQETQQLSQQFDTELRKMLVGKRYSEKLLPQARAYILHRVTQPGTDMEDATLDELPYLFGDWYREMEGARQEWLGGLVDGKQQDARLLPPTPGTSVPLVPSGKPGAMDESTMKSMEEQLAQRLGWNNNGGVS